MKPCYVRTIVVVAVALALSTTVYAQSIVSDDFNSYNLNRSVWTFVNPKGDAMLRMVGTGTQNAGVAITVPAGSDHQPFPPANTAPHLMQPIPDSNFIIQVKFTAPMTQRYQLAGVLIQGDESKAVRIDLSCQGDSIWLYGYTTSDNFASGTAQLNIWRSLFPKGTTPLYLRVTRIGNSYFVMDSTDNEWGTRVGGFTFEMKALKVGVYIGNFGFPAPEFTGVIDYFFNMTKPLPNDDANTSVPDTTGPLVYDVTPVVGQQSIDLSWKTDEPSSSVVDYGLTSAYGSSIVDTATTLLHSVTINGLALRTTYHLRITANDKHPSNATSTSNIAVTTGVVQAVGTAEQPSAFVLHQNYPNPFNAGTMIRYSLSTTSHVVLRVFNTLGQEVSTLVQQTQQPGEQAAFWDGRNLRGETVPSGIYLCRLQVMPSSVGGTPSILSDIRKMVFLK